MTAPLDLKALREALNGTCSCPECLERFFLESERTLGEGLLALLDRLEAAESVIAESAEWIAQNASLQHHGHNRPGTACEECQVLNRLRATAEAIESGEHLARGKGGGK